MRFINMPRADVLVDDQYLTTRIECAFGQCKNIFELQQGYFWMCWHEGKFLYRSYCCHTCALMAMPKELMDTA